MTTFKYSSQRPFAKSIISSTIAGTVLSLGSVAHAQLEEVVVTAQKRAESMQDVPIAISAFTEDAMRDMGITNATDLALATPGLVFTSVGTLGAPYLRGVGTRFTLNGLDNSVATYVGDRYIPRGSGNQLDLGIDVERVEVLKGPQGILYGRNATGGAVRIIKKPVTEEFEGTVRAGIGNYDLWEVAGTVNIPVTDTFGMRLSGQTTQRDAWQDNLAHGVVPGAVDDINNKDVTKLSSRFRWDMSPATVANLSVDYWAQDDYQGHDGALLGPPELNLGVAAFGAVVPQGREDISTDSREPTDGEELAGELHIEHAMDGVDLVSITTYADFDMTWTSEGDGTSAPLFTPSIAFDESETWSQEFRLTSSEGDLDWTVGAFYYEDTHSTEFNFFTAILPSVSQGRQTTETTAAALFGHIGWDLSDRWALKLGARYSYENRDVDLVNSNRAGIATITPGLPQKFDESWNELTPLVTLEYHMPNAMAYLTYTRGFKSGGYNFPATSTPDGLEPEILDMVELGLKGDYFDSSLRLNGSLYYYDYTDLQVTRASDTGGAPSTENAGEAQLYGLDLELTWLVTEAFTLSASLNVLDSEYDDYIPAPRVYNAILDGTINTASPTPGMGVPDPTNPNHAPFNQFEADGESLLRSSDYSYTITAAYEFMVGEGRLPLSVTYSYKDDYDYDFAIDPIASKWLTQDGYGLVNARAAYYGAGDKWSVSLWGKNLTDEEYFNEVAGNAMGLRGFWAMPRTYGATVEYQF
jgi:iron complex outermembrane receptor protein